MRIAVTADPYVPVPPRLYGGIERVVDFLVRGLVDRGHDVTLFAHPDSHVPAQLVGYGAPPHTGARLRFAELWQVGARLWRARSDFDVIHSFGRLAALAPVLPRRELPKIQSYQRDRLPVTGIRRALWMARGSLSFTACASHMYRSKDGVGDWTTVYNGVDLDRYTLVESVAENAPLAFLGRLERVKGAHHAIEIAKRSGRKLVMAGNRVEHEEGSAYFEDAIAPHLDGDRVEYLGAVDDAQKNALLGTACALLMPIEWDEPFGIVMAEAFACGTPVIGFARGSVPEVVRDGVNGFAVQGVDDAVEAVTRLECLDRRKVRLDAASRFGADVIVDAYEGLYRKVAGR